MPSSAPASGRSPARSPFEFSSFPQQTKLDWQHSVLQEQQSVLPLILTLTIQLLSARMFQRRSRLLASENLFRGSRETRTASRKADCLINTLFALQQLIFASLHAAAQLLNSFSNPAAHLQVLHGEGLEYIPELPSPYRNVRPVRSSYRSRWLSLS
ncbi:hypothetical protein GBF38_009283, partial [Nibea albiflora]